MFIPKISLASKCRLLFGVAVLLIIAATLLVPWVQMASLSNSLDVRRAEQIAMAAYLLTDLLGQEWTTAQAQLEHRWPGYARQLEFAAAPPTLISVEQAKARSVLGSRGFLNRAIEQLQANRTARHYWSIQDDDEGHSWIRFAWAVRAGETEPNPGQLKGIIQVRTPVRHEQTVWNAIVITLAGTCGGLAAIFVFYLITQRLILSPVRGLRGVAEQVTSGDLQVRSDIATGDEFQELAEAFNDMLVHLQATQEELKTINRSLDARVGELADANVALYESNRLKSEFIANVSHELRTPLVSIIGFAELLRDAQQDPPKDRSRLTRYAANIHTSGRMLLDIINDLLDLAKIEAGKLRLHLSEFDIADVCQTLIDFIRPVADKKNQQLELEIDAGLPALYSDSGKIKQILYNLLSNALKFTPAGGRILLDVTPDHGSAEGIRLAVSDTGPGIPEEQQAAIFEKFRQMDSSVTREHGGTGLGLAITQDLVHILGGQIGVESEVGRGCTFIVTLPVRVPEDRVPTGQPTPAAQAPSGSSAASPG
jgi:two-component system sensor histidine kinase BarA